MGEIPPHQEMHPQVAWLCDFVESITNEGALWDAQTFVGWMSYSGLPPVGRSELPYVWIWKGFQAIETKYGMEIRQIRERRFAEQLKKCWSELRGYIDRQGRDVNEHVGYNLWSLMALLKQPDIYESMTNDCIQLFDASEEKGEKPVLNAMQRGIRERLRVAADCNKHTPDVSP